MRYGNCFYGRGFGGNMIGFEIINLLVYAIIIAVIAYALVYVFKRSSLSKGDEALEKLKMMYVNGEISEEEFKKRKKIIDKK